MGLDGKLDGGRAYPAERPRRPAARQQHVGLQMALRYADPKITAVLSPSDNFADRSRFARVRFDAARRANYRCHWLSDEEIKKGTFCVSGIFSNGANEPRR